ncbi:MAG TPA: hypothetical protein VK053_09450 [Jiangellaceae bacterium]|nr:hypothetical protein [Jiangellaceae bacterium]
MSRTRRRRHRRGAPDSEQAAADRAVAFVRAFARPDLPGERWHAGTTGLMCPGGAELFAYVNPANVPASEVTGLVEVPIPPRGRWPRSTWPPTPAPTS